MPLDDLCGFGKMSAALLEIVESARPSDAEIALRVAEIQARVLGESQYLDGPNFRRIHPADLRRLVDEYDRQFFAGQIALALDGAPLHLGLSRRMTSAGGKTAWYANPHTGKRQYEIAVSTTILFGCFAGNDHRPITASGMVCHTRFDALQRIVEHELVHLIEVLLWDASSCSQPRFHDISRRFFRHTENKHKLITPRERAAVQFGIRPGSTVRFRYDGVEYVGVVNRVSKRATVLVEDPHGERYSNGKHYTKFYVPLAQLKHCESQDVTQDPPQGE